MSSQMWSWLLVVVGVTGFVLAGKKVWWAWYVNIACQGLWFAYGFISGNWGFVAGSLVYTVVFTKNAITWTREHNALNTEKLFAREVAIIRPLIANNVFTINDARAFDDVPPASPEMEALYAKALESMKNYWIADLETEIDYIKNQQAEEGNESDTHGS